MAEPYTLHPTPYTLHPTPSTLYICLQDLVAIFIVIFICLQDLVMAEALDKAVAFGRQGEQGAVERAMAISKMQGN